MRIKITGGGIYGADGELEIGTEIDVSEEPIAWKGRYEVIGGKPKAGSVAITNPAGDKTADDDDDDDKAETPRRGRPKKED